MAAGNSNLVCWHMPLSQEYPEGQQWNWLLPGTEQQEWSAGHCRSPPGQTTTTSEEASFWRITYRWWVFMIILKVTNPLQYVHHHDNHRHLSLMCLSIKCKLWSARLSINCKIYCRGPLKCRKQICLTKSVKGVKVSIQMFLISIFWSTLPLIFSLLLQAAGIVAAIITLWQ